jgi:hypothetical protein
MKRDLVLADLYAAGKETFSIIFHFAIAALSIGTYTGAPNGLDLLVII